MMEIYCLYMEESLEIFGIFWIGNMIFIYGNICNWWYKWVFLNFKKVYCDVNYFGEMIFLRKLNIELREKIVILVWVIWSLLIWVFFLYKIIYVVVIFVINNCVFILIDVDFCNGGVFIIEIKYIDIFFFLCCVDEGLLNCDI